MLLVGWLVGHSLCRSHSLSLTLFSLSSSSLVLRFRKGNGWSEGTTEFLHVVTDGRDLTGGLGDGGSRRERDPTGVGER